MKKRLFAVKNRLKKEGVLKTALFSLYSFFYGIVSTVYISLILKRKETDRNKVVFSSNPDFSDNAKSLFLYLQKTHPEYKYVWLVKQGFDIERCKGFQNTETAFINASWHHGPSLKALKEIGTAHYLLFTHGSPVRYLKKKERQIVINLWHGCGYKEIQKTRKTYISVNPFDYALVPGSVFIETKYKFWGCRKDQILTLGYPRYDLFFQESGKAAAFANSLKNAEDDRIIIWMPTFRNTGTGLYPEENNTEAYDLPLLASDAQLDSLNDYCAAHSAVICIKRHPYQLEYSGEKRNYSNIRFISNEDLVDRDIELYSLLKYTDALITDYSSVAIDYLLLNKPIAFSLDDYEHYKSTRGFVFDSPLDYMPGNHLFSFEDCMIFIQQISAGRDEYQTDREKIMPAVHNVCGNYSERLWAWLEALEG